VQQQQHYQLMILAQLILSKGQVSIGSEEMCDNGITKFMKANKHCSTSLPSHYHVATYPTFWVYTHSVILSTNHHEEIIEVLLLKVIKDFISLTKMVSLSKMD
jgi:hypothetical protein